MLFDPDLAFLLAVIAEIYDAAVDSSLWPKVMESTCRYVGGGSAVMFWHDAADANGDALYSYNQDPHYSRLYGETYAPLNPIFPAVTFRPVGSINAATDLVPEPELRATRFYKEWLAPQGLTDALGVTLEKEALRAAFLTVQWHGGTIDDHARRRMALLAPHLQRAVAIGRLFCGFKAKEVALTAALDHLEAAVFLVGQNGRVVFANASARRITADGALLQEAAGRLRAVSAEADRALGDSLTAVGEDEAIGTRGIAVPLSNGSGSRWVATVLPLDDGARLRAGGPSGALAAVFVRPSEEAPVTPLETLAATNALTASEIRVVEATLRISGLDAIAEALGISRATVKTHLNRVYRKCKTRNQAELIRMIAGLRQ